MTQTAVPRYDQCGYCRCRVDPGQEFCSNRCRNKKHRNQTPLPETLAGLCGLPPGLAHGIAATLLQRKQHPAVRVLPRMALAAGLGHHTAPSILPPAPETPCQNISLATSPSTPKAT